MKTIDVSTENYICTVRLNRPDVRNAFNDAMIEEMTEAFERASQDKSLRVVVLRGEGQSFCAGGDLNWMKSMVDYSLKENRDDSEKLFEMYQALANIPVPVVSFVHGHSMGGGLGLMAASDIVLSENSTKFCFSEVRLGLAPAVISHFVKTKIRPSDMSRYFLTAEVFGAAQAQEMGLVHERGSFVEMEESLEKITKQISNNGPQAVRATKSLIEKLESTADSKKLTTELIADLRVGDEGQEGLKAFFEKRKPNWLEA